MTLDEQYTYLHKVRKDVQELVKQSLEKDRKFLAGQYDLLEVILENLMDATDDTQRSERGIQEQADWEKKHG